MPATTEILLTAAFRTAPETMAVWPLRLRAQASSLEPAAIGRSLP